MVNGELYAEDTREDLTDMVNGELYAEDTREDLTDIVNSGMCLQSMTIKISTFGARRHK
jgi:hypothetical protein